MLGAALFVVLAFPLVYIFLFLSWPINPAASAYRFVQALILIGNALGIGTVVYLAFQHEALWSILAYLILGGIHLGVMYTKLPLP